MAVYTPIRGIGLAPKSSQKGTMALLRVEVGKQRLAPEPLALENCSVPLGDTLAAVKDWS